ncbi:MAG TPA: PAS domain S-box protein, partial [Chitinophagales bacterium]|nr:PAS domain S-box protein [Chitinophagales bacterium]
MTKNLIATNGHDPLVPTKSVTRDNAAEKIQQIKILHLEDLQSDALLVNQVLKKSKLKFETLVVDTKEKFADALADFAPDVVLADHFLPAFNSHEALVAFHDSGIDAPFILITAHISEEFAIDVINRGADDYILKDRLQRLPTAIQNLLEKFRLEKVQQVFVDELIKKEKHYRALVENGADAVVILNAEGKITYVSPSIERVLGYTEAEIMQLDLSSIVRPEDVAAGEIKIAESLSKPGVAINGHTARMLHKDGSWRWIEATIKNMLHDPDVNGIVDNFRDVTQRVLAEEKIIHANRLYNFISQINQTIVHTKDQQTLFNRVCRIAITLGKFKAAWIGIIDKTNQKVNLVEGFGLPEEDKDEYKNASYPNGGPLDHVLRTNRYFVCNDIPQDPDLHGWKPAAKNGYGSVMVLPIWKSGSIFGTFKLYAAEINFFNAAEIALLEEAAGDISFALDVFEKDRQKSAAEEKIIHNERKFRALIENSTDGLTVMTADGTVLDTSASSKKILGYDSKEIVGAF